MRLIGSPMPTSHRPAPIYHRQSHCGGRFPKPKCVLLGGGRVACSEREFGIGSPSKARQVRPPEAGAKFTRDGEWPVRSEDM